jgi:hypothetical protein
MPEFLARYFSGSGMREERLVGKDRLYDSGYYDIIRFFGPDAVKPSHIEIALTPGRFIFSDSRIKEFAERVAALLRSEGRLYDGPAVMKLSGLDLYTYPQTISLQECSYDDQAGSCFALDLPDPSFKKWGGTLREYYKSRYPTTDLEQNPLPICLGICGYLVTESPDGPKLFQVRRSGWLASLEDSYGPSVAGSVDFTTDHARLSNLIEGSLGAEIAEELGLQAEEYDINPLAYAREIFRGEKPQIFCFIETKLTERELSERILALRPERQEIDSFDFVPITLKRDARDAWLESINHEARMNYYLVEEYLETRA